MKKRLKHFLHRLGIFILVIMVCSCEKGSDDNTIQNDKTVKEALRVAGVIAYSGNKPPIIEGFYSTADMKNINASSKLSFLINQYMNSTFKLFNQTSEGEISFSEKTGGLWASGSGCFITGTGQNFTLWMSNTLSNGASTAFVLSGTYEPVTGNLTNCKSVTVYTKKSTSYNVGDWYMASGWIQGQNGIFGQWTTEMTSVAGTKSTWILDFLAENRVTYYIVGDKLCPLRTGTWSVSGQQLTMSINASICIEAFTKTGSFKLSNDNQLLTLTNLYIFSGGNSSKIWTRTY